MKEMSLLVKQPRVQDPERGFSHLQGSNRQGLRGALSTDQKGGSGGRGHVQTQGAQPVMGGA